MLNVPNQIKQQNIWDIPKPKPPPKIDPKEKVVLYHFRKKKKWKKNTHSIIERGLSYRKTQQVDCYF
jgi:hypothetical protein